MSTMKRFAIKTNSLIIIVLGILYKNNEKNYLCLILVALLFLVSIILIIQENIIYKDN